MVHVKDLAFAALNADAPLALARFRREIPRVQESMPVEALMRFIQRRPTNLALVTDAAGTVKGIVTFEDVLEELVGEIADEFEGEMPWRLSEHVDRASVVMGLKATDRMGAIRELAGALRHRAIGLDPNLVIEQAMGREAESPTAVGHGIALPHARLEGLGRCCVAYGRSLKGINFRAPDGLPVTHVFLILSPKERPRQQLQALARVAAIAASEILLGKLNDATTPEGVLELFAAADVSTTLDS
jgi:mannitol/fructose-specific phosphotransferase system IIA component (Ntr-type)